MADTEFVLDLDDTVEDIYYALEELQDGYTSHKLVFTGESKEKVAIKICTKLVEFFVGKLERI